MGIRVFGTLAVDDRAVALSPRDRIVLAALATRPGQVVSSDELYDALWGDSPPRSAAKVLQGCVVRLRRALGDDAIATVSPGYRLEVSAAELDVGRFEQLVVRSRELVQLGQPDRAAYVASEALAIWRGRPFADLENWEPATAEGARLHELRLEAEELRVEAMLQSGRHQEALPEVAALVHVEPLREHRWALLARAQYQDGRQGDALATIGEARATLVRLLGVDPGPELTDLETSVLRQDPALSAPARAADGGAQCPYRGLAHYGVEDRDDFYGREMEVAVCLRLLPERHVLAVVGPSGFGKSSLVRAGVAASLVQEGQRVRVTTPGDRPVAVLDAALGGAPVDVLVVDQAEELFGPDVDGAERVDFVRRLIDLVDGTSLVLALRADHMGDLAEFPELARLVEAGLHLVGPLDEVALRRVVEQPARQYGLLLEPGLVDLLVAEVQGEPGALPMLSHALRETWRRREGTTLTVAGYRASGGIRGAVSQTAERLFEEMTVHERDRLRSVLLRLVTPSPEGEPVRARVPRSRLGGGADLEDLVDRLVTARLVTSQEGVVEIAHESLARAWPRLRGWLDEDVESQRILHHLTAASDTWRSLGRPDSELYRGVRLERVLEWRETERPDLTDLEREYVEASRRAAEAEQVSLRERARRQTRLIRRLRLSLVAGTVLLMLALVASALAVRQGDAARRGELAAQAAERASEAGRLGALGLTVDDPVLALLLAVEGNRLDDSAQTRSFVREALARREALVQTFQTDSERLVGVDASPDGELVAGYAHEQVVWVFDAASGEIVGRHDLDGPEVTRLTAFPSAPLRFSPDSRTLAVGAQVWTTTDAVKLLDVPGATPAATPLEGLPRRPAKVVDLAWSRDGRHVAASFILLRDGQPVAPTSGPGDGQIRVWDLDRPGDRPAVIGMEQVPPWHRVELSPDGSVVYTIGPDRALEVVSGRVLWERGEFETEGGTTALSTDGRWYVTTDVRGVAVRDATTGDVVRRLGERLVGLSAAVSADGGRVAANLDDGSVRVWETRGWSQVDRFETGSFGPVAFGPDGARLYFTTASAGAVQVWDVGGARRFVTRRPVDLSQWRCEPCLWLSPDATRLAVRSAAGFDFDGDTSVTLLDTGDGSTLRKVAVGMRELTAPGSWHPDGGEFVAGDPDGRLVTVPLDGKVRRSRVSEHGLVGVDHSGDGERIVLLDEAGWVWAVESDGTRRVGRAARIPGELSAVASGPDGRWAVVLSGDATTGPAEHPVNPVWRLVDLDTGEVGAPRPVPVGTVDDFTAVHVSPDGSRLALLGGRAAWFVELPSGRLLRTPAAAHRVVVGGGFSADGSAFVSGGGDGTVVTWDPRTGAIEDRLRVEPDAEVVGVANDAGEIVAATGSAVYRWPTGTAAGIDAACRAAGRSMTQAEWAQYVGDRPYRATCG